MLIKITISYDESLGVDEFRVLVIFMEIKFYQRLFLKNLNQIEFCGGVVPGFGSQRVINEEVCKVYDIRIIHSDFVFAYNRSVVLDLIVLIIVILLH